MSVAARALSGGQGVARATALAARALMLAGGLFPPPASPAPQSGASRAGRSVAYLAGGAAVALAALARQTGVPAWRTMWAEDGKVFYSQALFMSFARTLVSTHAGYVQLFPRLVAGLAAALPAADASVVMALAGAVSLAVLSCLVFHMARAHIASPLLRLLLAASLVLLPVANGELLDNAVNVPWWLFFSCFWALLWRPRRPGGAASAGVLCALAAASEPLTALFLPIAALRVAVLGGQGRAGHEAASVDSDVASLAGRGRRLRAAGRQQAPVIGLAAGLCFQGVAILVQGPGGGATTTFRAGNFGALAKAASLRLGVGLLAGVRATNWLAGHELGLAVGAGVLVVLSVPAASALGSGRARPFAVLALASSLACFILEAWARGISPVLAVDHVQEGGRYQAVPLLLLVSSLLVTADSWAAKKAPVAARGSWHSRRQLAAAGLCACLLAPAWAADFRDPNPRSEGPSWPAGVAAAARSCVSGGARYALVPTAPKGWAARLPCRRIAQAASPASTPRPAR